MVRIWRVDERGRLALDLTGLVRAEVRDASEGFFTSIEGLLPAVSAG